MDEASEQAQVDAAPPVAPIQAQPGRFAEPKTVGVAPLVWVLLALTALAAQRRRR